MYFLSLPRSNLKDGSTGLVESARLDKWIWQGLAGGPGGVGACCAGKWESWAPLRASMAACCPPRRWACGGSWADAQHSPGPALGESRLSLRHRSSLKARLLSAWRHTPAATELCTAGIAWVMPQERAGTPFPVVAGPPRQASHCLPSLLGAAGGVNYPSSSAVIRLCFLGLASSASLLPCFVLCFCKCVF